MISPGAGVWMGYAAVQFWGGPEEFEGRSPSIESDAAAGAAASKGHHWQMEEAGGSGMPSFHFIGVTPGSMVSASQIRSEMHLCPASFG